MARQQQQFWRDLQVCFRQIYVFVQKHMFYTRTGRTTRVCVEASSMWRDMRMPVRLSACFCGLNPRTVPQLSLNKFRPFLGYRGLVLGLNVSYSFRSLGTFNGARVDQIRPSGSRRHNYVTKNCGHCWPNLDTCFCSCMFLFSFRCSRWCNMTGQISCTVT